MGGPRAGTQDARRCARDAAAGAARVRGGRARDAIPRASAVCSPSSSSAAVRPASSWPARWPRSRGSSLRQDFRNIRPESARIVLVEGGPYLLAAFPDRLARRRAAVARAPRRRGADRARSSRASTRDGVAVAAGGAAAGQRPASSASTRRRCCGRPASRRRRWRSRSACRSIAPAA